MAQTVRPPLSLFPQAAAPGDTVWIIGAPRELPPVGQLRVGGQVAAYSTDPLSRWLRFTVPAAAAGGPQPVQLTNVGSRLSPLLLRTALSLTVLPAESALENTVLYVVPSAEAEVQKTYFSRLEQLLRSCQRACPAELTVTLKRLMELKIPVLTTLTPGRKVSATPPTAAVPEASVSPVLSPPTLLPLVRPPSATLPPSTTLRPGLNFEHLVRTFPVLPRQRNFCGWVAGTLPTSGLPTGQVMGLLKLLFGDNTLGIDPSTAGHPLQASAPYKNAPPAEVLQKFLGGFKGSGKGVTIHVLDTASAGSDPFVMPDRPAVNYYEELVFKRLYHGSIVGQVAQAVAPGARLDYQQVCDATGRCFTLAVVQALCAVAGEARQGGKHIVNLSAGSAYPALGLQLALRELAAAGVPTVAAYGNSDDCALLVAGDHCNHYPADWTSSFATSRARNAPTMLLSVGGWDIATQQTATYNRGHIQGVALPGLIIPPPSVLAPGEFWFSGKPYFGTSFAAPVVSGVLANWMSCQPGTPALPLMITAGQLPLPQGVVRACP